MVTPKLGNEKSIYVGLGLHTLGMVLFAFASQSWMMFAFLIPYCLGGICGPSLQAVISSHVPANEQGELQGALTSMMSATTIVGPPLMTNLFRLLYKKECTGIFSGSSFFTGRIFDVGKHYISVQDVQNRKINGQFVADRVFGTASCSEYAKVWKSSLVQHFNKKGFKNDR